MGYTGPKSKDMEEVQVLSEERVRAWIMRVDPAGTRRARARAGVEGPDLACTGLRVWW